MNASGFSRSLGLIALIILAACSTPKPSSRDSAPFDVLRPNYVPLNVSDQASSAENVKWALAIDAQESGVALYVGKYDTKTKRFTTHTQLLTSLLPNKFASFLASTQRNPEVPIAMTFRQKPRDLVADEIPPQWKKYFEDVVAACRSQQIELKEIQDREFYWEPHVIWRE
jgi:hypothetical protein